MAQINLPTVTPIPTPTPSKADQINFATRAAIFVDALSVLNAELDALVPDLNDFNSNLDGSEPVAEYDGSASYSFPDLAVASNGYLYRCLSSAPISGVDPIGSTSWKQQCHPLIGGESYNISMSVDVTAETSPITLDVDSYRYFRVFNFDKTVVLQFSGFDVGETALIALVDPGLNGVSLSVTGAVVYPDGMALDIDPVGVTLISVTRQSSTVYVADCRTGYNLVV